MEIALWSLGLLASLFILVRGADAFVDGAKEAGASFGLSKFIIGVLIVGFGTSLPEFASSFAAALKGATDIAIANVVGSNITNILLIVGLTSFFGGTIIIRQDLIRTELPVFFIATTHFIVSLWDGVIDQVESLLLLGTFAAYVWYLVTKPEEHEGSEVVETASERTKVTLRSVLLIVGGLVALLIGAKFSVDMIENIGGALAVPVGLISITVLAIGTSLPELFVSVRAALKKEHELAIGNIFGSNAFNALFVIGVPGVLAPLTADTIVMQLGIPVLLASSAILFVSGLSKRIMRWEGVMLLIFFAFFMAKLSAFL